MKKALSIILAVVLVTSVLPFSLTASAATSGTTGDCTWTLDGTVLTISGNGTMGNYYSFSSLPWGKLITKVVFEEGVTNIGSYAFRECADLTNITIPNSITSIGKYAFYGCTRITSINIPSKITSVGEWAFGGCISLTSVQITDVSAWCHISFDNADANPLRHAKFLYVNGVLASNITIPNNITSVQNYTFYRCVGLKEVIIPNSVTKIGKWAFYDCSNLESVTIPNTVTSIDAYAFFECEGLKNITIPNSVTSVNVSVFDSCTSLTSVTIPNSIKKICMNAFNYCINLTDIYYEGSKNDWANVEVEDKNYQLDHATIHYNYRLTPDIKYGLVTENEEISATDALTILHAVVGKVQFTDAQNTAGDVDGDGVISATDALLILHFIVGKITKFPVEG